MVAALPVAAVAALLAFSWGGYYESDWAWSALVLGWSATVAALVLRRPHPPRLLLWWTAALTLLAAWTLLSATWSDPLSYAVLEGRRALIYVAAAFALAAAAARPRALATTVAAAATVPAAYALARHVLPDALGGYDPILVRLSEPLGYANAMGALTAIGAAAALGVATTARATLLRAAAGAALVVLLSTLAFTVGRGAWLSLAAGLAVGLALAPRRLAAAGASALVLFTPVAGAVAATRTDALTIRGVPLAEAADAGRRLALVLGALAVAAAAAAAIAPRVYRRLARVSVPALLHRATIAASVSTLVAVVVLSGGPSGLVHRGVSGFTAPPRPTESESTRLLTLSSNLRDAYWRAAWEDARAHPLLGSGAGTFGDYWRAHPRLDTSVLDAHNLYLETLAELGPVGLALVLALAGLPLAAAVRARRHPVVPAAAAAWVAYLVHAALDWDWEMPAVTLVALAAAAVPLSASGARVRLPRIAAACAGGAVAALAIAGTFAYASV